MPDLSQQILDFIQDGFPIVERPYVVIADKFNEGRFGAKVTENQVHEIVERLRESGLIRRLGGVYDSKRLGFMGRLCAGKVPSVATGATDDSALEQFARAVMKIPAITHNYVRTHDYNVWFTIIAENETAMQSVIDKLCAETSLHDVHSMPATRMFKINTVMKKGDVNAETFSQNVFEQDFAEKQIFENAPLTDFDRARIHLLCGDLPHSLTPFTELSPENLESFLEGAQSDLASKRMRRFGAVLRHQNAGFPCNAMVCFKIEQSLNSKNLGVPEAGIILAGNPHVSHCYERPPFEDFPYNIYAMFHAQSNECLLQYVSEIAKNLGNPPYAILRSVQELKKTSYEYFA